MDIEKFRKSSSGKIIKAGQGDTAYWIGALCNFNAAGSIMLIEPTI
jgi:hypothetical protein